MLASGRLVRVVTREDWTRRPISQLSTLHWETERSPTTFSPPRPAASRELRAEIKKCQLNAMVSSLVDVEFEMSILRL